MVVNHELNGNITTMRETTMSKNYKLTPELESALRKANVAEEKIAAFEAKDPDVEKLSLDDLDNISGGAAEAPDDYVLYGMTQLEAGRLLQGIVDNFGTDIAISMANAMWCKTTDWERYLRESEGCNAGYYAVFRIWGKGYEAGRTGKTVF